MNADTFDILIGRIDGVLYRLTIPEIHPLHTDYLNFFCGIRPIEWLDKKSYHRVILLTSQLREQLVEIINRHSDTYLKSKDLKSFFDGIEDNTPFFFLRLGVPMSDKIVPYSYAVLSKHYKENCYSVISYGYTTEKTFVGHRVHSERVCRFCGKKYPDVNFKDENAHAIPDGLGNKLLFCYDECTSCNNKLNNSFEKDFVVYLDVRRALSGIRGKKKIPTVYGHNYKLEGPTQELSISKYAIIDETDDSYFIKLEGFAEISHLNLYKALIKFVVNLADESMLSNFKNAVGWLNDRFLPPNLPNVYYVYHHDEDTVTQPRIRIYVRKDNLSYKSGPYCIAELDILDLTYIFIIPFVPADDGHFLSKDEVNPFLQRFITSLETKSYNLEYIDMADRQVKFSHVKEWVKKENVNIVPTNDFERLQETKKDLIEFPDIENIRLSVPNINISHQSVYRDASLSYDKSKIIIKSDVDCISDKSFKVTGHLEIAPAHTDKVGLKIDYNAICQARNRNEIVGETKDKKGSIVVEFNGKAILYTLEVIAKRMQTLYSDDLPSFDFCRLPESIMEHSGIIINPNQDAEKTIMPIKN